MIVPTRYPLEKSPWANCRVCDGKTGVHWEHVPQSWAGANRPLFCPHCEAPIFRQFIPLEDLLTLLVNARAEVVGMMHLPEYRLFQTVQDERDLDKRISELLEFDVQGFVEDRLSSRMYQGSKQEHYRLMFERLRSQANSGLLEWRIRDVGERARALLIAERERHLRIRDARRASTPP